MNHTPEPWVIDETERSWLIVKEQPDSETEPPFYEIACVGGDLDDAVSELEQANAERIVACVNACAGIDTQAVLALQPGDLAEVWQQRGELLAACEDVLRRFGTYDWESVHDAGVFEALAAAVRKAKGGA